MAEGFNAYHKWLGIPLAEQPANHYRLLGIGLFEEDSEVIEGACDRAMAHVRTFQAGPHSALSQQILNELAAARIALLDPQKKAAYDRELRRSLSPAAAPAPRPAPAPAAPVPIPVAPLEQGSPPAASRRSTNASPRPARRRPMRSSFAGSWMAAAATLLIGVLIAGAAIYRFQKRPRADIAGNRPGEQRQSADQSTGGSQAGSATSQGGSSERPNNSSRQGVAPSLVSSEGESATASPGAIDLLAKINPDTDAAYGRWEKRGDRLLAPGTAFARLEIPFEPPEEYELTGTVECDSHADGFCLGLVVGNAQTTLIVDGANQTTWLDQVDQSGSDNETAKSGRFLKDGQPNMVVCTVRKTGVQVVCNGATLIDWNGAAGRLSTAPWWKTAEPRRLYLGTLGPSYTVSKLELRPLGTATSADSKVPRGPADAQREGDGRGKIGFQAAEGTIRIRKVRIKEASSLQPPPAAVAATPGGVNAGSAKADRLGMEDLIGEPRSSASRIESSQASPAPASQRRSLADLTSRPQGLPSPPEGEMLAQAKETVANRYKADEAAAKTPLLKAALAQQLIQEAQRVDNDPALRYALLDKAWRLAADSGGAQAAFAAIDELDRSFNVDALALKLEALKAASQSPPSLPSKQEQLSSAQELIETAADEDRYVEAKRAASLALQAARALKDLDAKELLSARLAELERQDRAYAAGKAALEKLRAAPDDAEAHLAAGKYFCFVKGDWDEGIKHLAAGSDEALKSLALSESAHPSGVSEERAVGDAWWEQSKKEKSNLKAAFAERAGHWYRRALPYCSGAEKLTLEQRIQEIEGQTSAGKVQFLAELPERSVVVPKNWFSKGTNVLTRNPIRIGGEPSPHALLLHPPEKGSSSVKYELAKKAQRLSLAVAIDDPARASIRTPLVFQVYGDGRLLWTSPKIFRDQMARCYIDLRTVDTLELRVNCRGNAWSAHAVWVEPRVTWK